MAFAVKNAIPHVDELVKEYLLFRGFNKTLQSFESEKKNDKMRGFEVLLLTQTSCNERNNLTHNILPLRFANCQLTK